MRIPYVIDNQNHKMADILCGLLGQSLGESMDVATAYFTVGGFALLREGLTKLGSFRLLLGAEPRSGEEIGLEPDAGAVRGLRKRDLCCTTTTKALLLSQPSGSKRRPQFSRSSVSTSLLPSRACSWSAAANTSSAT